MYIIISNMMETVPMELKSMHLEKRYMLIFLVDLSLIYNILGYDNALHSSYYYVLYWDRYVIAMYRQPLYSYSL